jgi:hypothetical protein
LEFAGDVGYKTLRERYGRMKALTGGACLFFLTFAIARAARVPLTYDEAAAYLRYIDSTVPSVFNTGLLSIFNFEVATNHFLNTALTKACYLVAGGSEFVLRVPNLLGYAMYLGFSGLILNRYTRSAVAFAGCLLLNLNPYVLDFFTLSRGYGLSLGFLMGAVWFLLRVLERAQNRQDAARDVLRSLAFGCGAVMANFALLNAFVALFGVAGMALIAANLAAGSDPRPWGTGSDPVRTPDAAGAADPNPRGANRHVLVWLPLAAVLFAALVMSQDAELSPVLYEPITITLVGLTPPQLDAVRVTRFDIRGRQTRLGRDGGTTSWHMTRSDHVRSLQIELPGADAPSLARIEVIIGNHPFSATPQAQGFWNGRDAGDKRVFESGPALAAPRSIVGAFRPVLNWAGDRRYFRQLLAHTGYAVAILALLAVLLRVVGWLIARAHVMSRGEWRSFEAGALWVAAFAGTPLYLLRRDSELYFGGTHGLFQDTFSSIIENSFYGKTYHAAQTSLVFTAVAATIVAFCFLVAASYRRRTISPVLPAAVVLAVILIASLSIAAQGVLLHTVYLVGRTALFFIPLYVLFFVLLCEAVASSGGAAKVVAFSALAMAVSLSAFHFASTANLSHTLDWQSDASTKAMMRHVALLVTTEGGAGSEAVLAVDWVYRPVAVYYAQRTTTASIEVVGMPPPGVAHFLYLEARNSRPSMAIVRRYSLAGSVLVRSGLAP